MWVPDASEVVVKEADPEVRAAEPTTVAPSRNWTVPVAEVGLTVALKVTDWPGLAGFGLAVRATVLAVFTVSEAAVDVAVVLAESPE